jgi:hypothetical protein
MHANELENHSEWKKVAEDICNNPKCDVVKTVASPTPQKTTTNTSTPKPTPISQLKSTQVVSSSPTASPSATVESTQETQANSEAQTKNTKTGFFGTIRKSLSGVWSRVTSFFKK